MRKQYQFHKNVVRVNCMTFESTKTLWVSGGYIFRNSLSGICRTGNLIQLDINLS